LERPVPGDQLNEYGLEPPVGFVTKLTTSPLQIVVFDIVLTLGKGFTVTDVVAVADPHSFVTVSVIT
jgi:hypothetical protein